MQIAFEINYKTPKHKTIPGFSVKYNGEKESRDKRENSSLGTSEMVTLTYIQSHSKFPHGSNYQRVPKNESREERGGQIRTTCSTNEREIK